MASSNKDRKFAAYLARQYYTGQKSLRELEDDYPINDNDPDLNRLIRLLRKTPKKDGLFKVSKAKYEEFVSSVYNLIEEMEKQ